MIQPSHSENWDGTYDGLTAWEQLLVQVGYEVGIERAREQYDGLGCRFTREQEEIFLAVVRRKKAENA